MESMDRWIWISGFRRSKVDFMETDKNPVRREKAELI